MTPETVVLIGSMTVRTRTVTDRLTRGLLVVIALALAWLAVRPHVVPVAAEASRDSVAVNLERVGGRYLSTGVIPIDCRGGRP